MMLYVHACVCVRACLFVCVRIQVRMMLPMSIRCNTCGTYLYKGTKFNSRKEDAGDDESYLGIRVVRLYFRCPSCASELAIKTDPKNSDYVVELGATRNYEPWKARENAKAEAEEEKKKDEDGDAMRQLENRANESKVENEIMNALDEMVSLNARKEAIMRGGGTGGHAIIEAALRGVEGERGIEDGIDEHDDNEGPGISGRNGDITGRVAMVKNDVDVEDDDEVRRAFEAQREELMGTTGVARRRLNDDNHDDDDDDDDENLFRRMVERSAMEFEPLTSSLFAGATTTAASGGTAEGNTATHGGSALPRFKVIQRKKPAQEELASPVMTTALRSGGNSDDGGGGAANDDEKDGGVDALGLLGGYGSSSDDEDGSK